jgi:hypothetical protein
MAEKRELWVTYSSLVGTEENYEEHRRITCPAVKFGELMGGNRKLGAGLTTSDTGRAHCLLSPTRVHVMTSVTSKLL